ncbi:MAG: hypothetical protein PGN25_17890 [Methylorubrum populi]
MDAVFRIVFEVQSGCGPGRRRKQLSFMIGDLGCISQEIWARRPSIALDTFSFLEPKYG